MARTATFSDRVRKGDIPGPNIRTFDPAVWQLALHDAGQEGEMDLVRAGLWFGAELRKRWDALGPLGMCRMSTGALTRHIGGVANLMHLHSEALIQKAALEVDPTTLPSGSLAQRRLGDGPKAATADMIRTSSIDTMGKFAAFARSSTVAGGSAAAVSDGGLKAAGLLFEDIYLLEFLWGQVLWSGWRMHQESLRTRFTRPDPDSLGVSLTVSEFRRDQLFAEFYATFSLEWQRPGTTLPLAWKVQTRTVGSGISFRASRAGPGEVSLPATYALRELLSATELAPYIDEPLPLLGDPPISLNDLLLAWELLALAADGLCRALIRRGRKASVLGYAPTVRLSELETLLEPTGWSPAKRTAVIRFFVFEGPSLDGLWARPLLYVGSGRVVPVLTPLSCPNLLRSAELWITAGAGEQFFKRRGTEAEVKIRESLARSVSEGGLRVNTYVSRNDWAPKIAGAKRDIDLLLRIGHTVFVGEMKLKKHPVSAAEIGRHAAEFAHAADQLDIRLEWMRRNKTILAEQAGFDGDPEDLNLQGFVLTGTPFGSGTRAGSYPVVDIDSLEFFFQQQPFVVSAVGGPETGFRIRPTRLGHALALVESDPAASFLAWLRDPLHVRHAELALVKTTRPGRLTMTGHDLEWEEAHIDAEKLGPGNADSVAARLGQAWLARQQIAARDLAPMQGEDGGPT